MQKCNPFYRLNNKLKDESGVTLVELLAVLSILSVFIILAGSIHIFGQKQFVRQTESASQANDFSYALTIMTSELRVQDSGKVEVGEDENSAQDTISIDGTKVFWQEGERILYEGTSIAEGVGKFKAVKLAEYIEISITKSNLAAADKNYHTIIYFRGEPIE